ncbi:MAG: hypothetical protein IKO19_00260 [Candidatus Riflebacteria bacterium]|nr:hypothetical protein [Candidatus Riflebacteria bacterium]
MENSVELTQTSQVIASENTNNSEIETKSIEENKISDEVTTEKEEKETKILETNKPFKWTNEATKAAGCMLKDIIDDYKKSSNSASTDEEISDPWNFTKIKEQIKVLVEIVTKKLNLFPENTCRFKLASLLKNYFDEHCKAICIIREHHGRWSNYKEDENSENLKKLFEYDFNYFYYALFESAKNNINYEGIAEGIIRYNYDYENDGFLSYFYDHSDEYTFDVNIKNSETKIIADIGWISEEEYEEALSFPEELQVFSLVEILKKSINDYFPKIEDIDEIKGLKDGSKKDYNLMLELAECSYRSIDFLNLADAFLTEQIKDLKGLKETYAEMF